MNCPKCGSEMADGSAFCTKCGASLTDTAQQSYNFRQEDMGAQQAGMNRDAQQQNAGPQAGPNAQQGSPNPQMGGMPYGNPNPNQQMGGGMPYGNPQMNGMPQQTYFDPKDHTAEFDMKDISDNKVMAMLPYLLGTIGIIIALLACRESPFTYFHVRQALKITVVNVLLGIITLLLCWTVIVPIAGAVCAVILLVIRIICFFQICSGKAKEAPIVSSFGFLN